MESKIEVLLWGERKRSAVFTTFGGRSTVIESSRSFGGTILDRDDSDALLFYFYLKFISGRSMASAGILRVRNIERAS